jgi:hypothetical protein
MRAWISVRREDGAALAATLPLVSPTAPLELLIVYVTDQGSRRPMKVARVGPIGEQQIIAELLASTAR